MSPEFFKSKKELRKWFEKNHKKINRTMDWIL